MTNDTEAGDAELVAAVIRRWMTDSREYWCVGDDWLTLDGKVALTSDEAAAFRRLSGDDGQGWWRRVEGRLAH